jgi:peptidyl-prolyl cis-trans isomerase SurA
MATALFAGAAILFAGIAQAQQNLFAPAIRVADRIITVYDVQQRTLLLTLLNAGEDPQSLARTQLVTEALQFLAADRDGIVPNPQEVADAQSAFAAQGNLERDQFIQALLEQGVEEGTFRNLIASSLVWRDAVRRRFGPRIEVTEIDIDRALAQIPSEAGTRIEIAEIILPADDPATEAASIARANRIRQLTDFDEFSAAARLFSISPSRFEGGNVGWRPVEVLPEAAATEIVRLSTGQVTRPTRFGETVAIFQLRDREDVRAGSVDIVSADYAEYLIPGGASPEARAQAAQIAREVRTCDDLYGIARGQQAERLTRQTTRLASLPRDVASEIAGLDENEISINLTRGGNRVLLMLCERTVRESAAVDRQLVRQALTSQRLETFAAGYLNELRLAIDITVLR